MGASFDSITDRMVEDIEDQHVFFVATAPDGPGHINLSPKGYDSFRILGPNRVAYADITGSGAETIAHVRQNGRITFMFCRFSGRPNIVRLYGTAKVVLPGDDEFVSLLEKVGDRNGLRSIIVADIHRTSNSCGFSVPFMDYVEERSKLDDHWEDTTSDELAAYHRRKNAQSIDGLAALT